MPNVNHFLIRPAFLRQAALLTAALLAASATSRAQTPTPGAAASAAPTLDQIIERYEAAIGGREAWQKLNTMQAKGSVEMLGGRASGTVEILTAAPNKVLIVFNLVNVGTLKQGCDGKSAWRSDAAGKVEQLTGNQLAEAIADSDFYSDFNLRKRYAPMKSRGSDIVDGRKVYVVEGRRGPGSTRLFYFSAASGLELRNVINKEGPNGQESSQQIETDYKEVDGIKMPFTVRYTNPDMAVHLTEVHFNVPIDPAVFEVPGGAPAKAEPSLRPDSGEISGNTYLNSFFGFSYQFPKDWIVHGEETAKKIMDVGENAVAGDDKTKKAAIEAARKTTFPLLTVFQFPLGTPGKLNPAVILIAEDVSSVPSIQTAEDYLLVLNQTLTGPGAGYVITHPPAEVTIAGRSFFREQARKDGKVMIFQSIFSTIEKSHALVFIFTAGDEATLATLGKTVETVSFQ